MLRINTSIPIIEPVVPFSFAIIRDKTSFLFPIPNLPSTSLRSPISFNSCRRSSARVFPGRPSFGSGNSDAVFLPECVVMTATIDFISQDSFKIMSELSPVLFYNMNKLFGTAFVVCAKTQSINKRVTIDNDHGNLNIKFCWGFCFPIFNWTNPWLG